MGSSSDQLINMAFIPYCKLNVGCKCHWLISKSQSRGASKQRARNRSFSKKLRNSHKQREVFFILYWYVD